LDLRKAEGQPGVKRDQKSADHPYAHHHFNERKAPCVAPAKPGLNIFAGHNWTGIGFYTATSVPANRKTRDEGMTQNRTILSRFESKRYDKVGAGPH
jgi:hypothetical protein